MSNVRQGQSDKACPELRHCVILVIGRPGESWQQRQQQIASLHEWHIPNSPGAQCDRDMSDRDRLPSLKDMVNQHSPVSNNQSITYCSECSQHGLESYWDHPSRCIACRGQATTTGTDIRESIDKVCCECALEMEKHRIGTSVE